MIILDVEEKIEGEGIERIVYEGKEMRGKGWGVVCGEAALLVGCTAKL